MAETKKIPERAELAQQDKWAIEDIYATDELWEADLEKARGYIPKIAAFAGHLGESAQMLLAYAQMEEEIEVLASDLANYAMRRADEDVRVAKYQAMTGRLMSSFVELNAAGSFATPELADAMLDYCAPRKINLSLPSLRADNFSRDLMLRLQQVRKSGLTFAPEAGTQRLRDAINKNVTEQEILDTCAIAFEGGWNNVKLYFMLGLPTETDEDVLGIAKLVYEILKTWREHASNKKRGVRIHVATAFFVPKPFTPFQWEKQITPEEYLRRARLLKDNMPSKSIEYNWHAADLSRLEAVLARGDRRLGPVLEEAVRRGARLDGWDEYFSYQTWLDAFAACGVDPDFYTTRGFGLDELLPWDTISDGVSTGCLLRERERAYRSETTPDCRTACNGCGANCLLKGGRCDA